MDKQSLDEYERSAMNISYLKDKKIVIAGLGVNNKHLAGYLKAKGVKFTIVEKWDSLDELDSKFQEAEIIFRTPGLPFSSKPIQDALDAGKQVYSQTKFFFDLCSCPIIGVTGTKGKGTTASLIAKIIEQDGKKNVWLAGNIGQDPFEFVDQIKPNDLVVLELSSFQLQDLHKSPHIAVVLNISRDHIDESKTKTQAIHYSFEEYTAAKSQILIHQNKHDYAVLGVEVPEKFQSCGQGKKILVDVSKVKDYKTKLLGQHNLDNIAAAREVGLLLGVSENVIKAAVSEFAGLPYRLQDLGETRGVRVYNDGLSTSPIATIMAVKSFSQPIVLIVGGFNKGVDFSELGELILKAGHVKAMVVMGDETEKILEAVQGFKGEIRTGAKNIQEIVTQAFELTQKGDAIVFSPGTSSFDMFVDEFDRSEKFEQTIRKI